MQLAEWEPRFSAQGVAVAAMSYDSVDVIATFAKDRIDYPLLSDAAHTHVQAFGILNEQYAPGHSAYGVPHPGILFVDEKGTVRLSFALPDYRERPALAEVFDAVSMSLAEPESPPPAQ